MKIYTADLSRQLIDGANRVLPVACKLDYVQMDLEALRVAIDVLRITPDDADTFPKGKWATVQALQQLVDGL